MELLKKKMCIRTRVCYHKNFRGTSIVSIVSQKVVVSRNAGLHLTVALSYTFVLYNF